MLMGLALTAVLTEMSAQSRGRSTSRKPAVTADSRRPSTQPATRPSSGHSARPSGPSTRPSGPTTRPNGPTTRPSGPSTRPNGPATRPNTPSTRPSGPTGPKPGGPAAKPPGQKPSGPGYGPKPGGPKPGGPKPDYGYRPGPKPGPYPPRPGYGPAPRPPKPPKPVIVVRPSYGSIIAANVAVLLARDIVRATTRPTYYPSGSLNLRHSYIGSGTDYYYQDGVFYIVNSYGQYITIVPPTGALVAYLPDDYTTFRRSGNLYYRVDDTVYALTLIDGQPFFKVLGQLG